MQILTKSGTTEYDHPTKTVTRCISPNIALISLTAKLPKTYDNHDPLELLNAIANLDSEDFKGLAEFQLMLKAK